MNSTKFLIQQDVQSSFTNSTWPNGKYQNWQVPYVQLTLIFLFFSPDNVRSRNDMFYLLPERSCVPDSPMWYSGTNELPEHQVDKMLQRILMVREVQEHMLADGQALQ